jgi:putative endonuclease
MANRRCGTLYVGSTSDIARRVWEHRHAEVASFTKRYGIRLLVYLECHELLMEARRREAQIKRWQRLWKIRLIESFNPQWCDLSAESQGS